MSKKTVRLISFLIGGIIAIAGILLITFDLVPLGIVFLFGSLITAFLPYGVYSFFKNKALKNMEDHFPSLLRDLAEAQKSGVSLSQAFMMVKNRDYGILSTEVKSVSNQISWGIPFPEVIKKFAKRIEDSDLMKNSLAIILQSFYSGGDIAKTMDTLASDAMLIKDAEKQRKAVLNQQVFIIYIIFFLFVAIIVALFKFMVPLLASGFEGISGAGPKNFCSLSISEWMCEICALFRMGVATDNLCYYKTLFLFMVLIESIFTGLVAGYVGEGKLSAGLGHIFPMLLIGILAHIFFIAI